MVQQQQHVGRAAAVLQLYVTRHISKSPCINLTGLFNYEIVDAAYPVLRIEGYCRFDGTRLLRRK
jgi:hypothetical protein